MGGMFGAIGTLGALIQRGISGKGMEVQSALFENNIFLVAQHMMQFAATGQAAAPMPSRISAWGVYDVFTCTLSPKSIEKIAMNFSSAAIASCKRRIASGAKTGRTPPRAWIEPKCSTNAGMSSFRSRRGGNRI